MAPEYRYEPHAIESRWQELWARERTWEVDNAEADRGEQNMYVTGFSFCPETHDERVAVAEYVHGVFQQQFDILAG